MSGLQWILAILLGIGALTGLEAGIGVLVMRDPFQKLHYIAIPAGLSAIAITIAVIVQEGIGQAALKAILTTLVLMGMNGVVTHATARAARIRKLGRLPAEPEERIPIAGRDHYAGETS